MRHLKRGVKLNRTSSHRRALMSNLVTSLLREERIQTTDPKAKEVRRWTDHVIGLGKQGTLHARRQALGIIRDEAVVRKLFDTVAPRFKDRPGGYTRIVKVGWRRGDHAPLSMVELLPGVDGGRTDAGQKVKKRPWRSAKKESKQGAAKQS
ncbi:MAG: 50S ribosomal protein L17 [Deltaproteobacteria bacterium]|nr:50S ribosomal protein L17 [Deltaproteobacteria bacterium]